MVYSRIGFKMFLVICNEVLLMRICIHINRIGKISDLLNRLLHEFPGLMPAINLKFSFVK